MASFHNDGDLPECFKRMDGGRWMMRYGPCLTFDYGTATLRYAPVQWVGEGEAFTGVQPVVLTFPEMDRVALAYDAPSELREAFEAMKAMAMRTNDMWEITIGYMQRWAEGRGLVMRIEDGQVKFDKPEDGE